MAKPSNFDELSKKISLLCARCEYLHRENLRLKQDNRQLRSRNEKAKKELGELIAVLPEYEE